MKPAVAEHTRKGDTEGSCNISGFLVEYASMKMRGPEMRGPDPGVRLETRRQQDIRELEEQIRSLESEENGFKNRHLKRDEAKRLKEVQAALKEKRTALSQLRGY